MENKTTRDDVAEAAKTMIRYILENTENLNENNYLELSLATESFETTVGFEIISARML